MKPFIVTIKYHNGTFAYFVFAENENKAKRKAQDFGIHCHDKKAICPPSVTVESVADAFGNKHIPEVSRIM